MSQPMSGVVRVLVLLCAVLIPVSLVDVAAAGPPADQLRGQVDRVIKVLVDPELLKPSRAAERREAIRRIANDIFDFEEIARRTLGRHWQARTPDERREFVLLMAELLEHAYIGKIETYSGEKVQFLGDTIDGDVATVKTRIVLKAGTEIPVDYRMIGRAGRWTAYDVFVEGVSLVSNYRGQFDRIIQRQSYAELVKALRAKQAERKDDTGRREKLAETTATKAAVAPSATPAGAPRTQSP